MQHQPTAGLCQCGCGQPAPIAKASHRRKGYVKGQPMRYIRGHSGVKRAEWYEEDRGYTSPCWIWQLAVIRATGYGTKKVDGISMPAHRAIYERLVGPVPDGLKLDHLCRVRQCVNPDNLESVTHTENVRRGVRDSPTWGHAVTDLARAIWRDLEDGAFSRNEIAAKHGVHKNYVGMIARGERGPNTPRRRNAADSGP